MNPSWRVGKRWGDLGLALIGAGCLAPAGLLAALLIRLTSPGPILLRQWRQGLLGTPFALLKFRSMTADGRHVTPLGRWLRATAMDELPQLVNILRDEMSFIGPRPLLAGDLAALSAESDRALAVPGLAGLAQLYAGKHPSPDARMALDLRYARSHGARLDGWILCRAVVTSVRARWEPPR